MRTQERLRPIVYVGIGVLILAILGVLLWALLSRETAEPAAENAPIPTPEVIIREKEVERIVEVEKTITAAMLREGLADMGVLVTEEYYFTEVISHSTVLSLDLDLKLFQINEPLSVTESSFLASYDGVVTAGIDFTAVAVEKDDADHVITVTLPASEILAVDVDPESFQLYDEKKGIGTRITVEDYNDALTELERTAADRAVARGLLDKADENAETVVRNFIQSIVGVGEYAVVFAPAQS